MYRLAVGLWGIQPSEFWNLDTEEWWWIADAHRPRDQVKTYAGTLTQNDVEELDEWLRQAEQTHSLESAETMPD